ncbi:MAG TPA: OmpA family protein [Candidatus Polarisedimenticolaceae bacterium]|nr:OmpA family protein [Candidatus Polarisedimenticolaceae bacterium]
MRRSAALLLAAAVLSMPAVGSTEDERPWEIGILAGAGMGDDTFLGSSNDSDLRPLFGGRLGYHFSTRLSLGFDATWVDYSGEPTLFGDVSEMALRVGPEWYFNPRSNWQFFLNVGGGLMTFSPDTGDDDHRGFASLGLGLRRAWRPGALRFELRGDRTVSGADTMGDSQFTVAKLVAGWTWGIGGRAVDSDGDGVRDKADQCPNTPHGCTVDARGCPLDGDGDGVCDGLDRCPDTPAGWPVDADGCSQDSDGDQVPDGKDKCPDTPKGCSVNTEGCPTDADGDRVCDGIDSCPNTPRGCQVDPRGCPQDADGDGVCNGVDQCPDTEKGLKVDPQGCPPALPAPPPPPPAYIPEPKKELVLEGVYFETASAQLKPESQATLDKVAASLQQFPDVKILVAGHTDSVGTAAYNMKLSTARAKSVRDYLVAKGVNPANLDSSGFGESQPVADNNTAEGRARNRRVGLRRRD